MATSDRTGGRQAPAGAGPARRRRRPGFRRDIEGLRAVAVVAVVLYHAHVGLLRGGFTGVDVFYVISGFLITGLLWRELEHGRRLSFRAFYGRRVRRLLPMSFLVLAATAVATAVLVPPLQARGDLHDGVSAAFYVSNYRFAALQTSYLTASAPPSPFQQYWSLSLEEQFYLVWPAVLLGASLVWRAGRRRRLPSRRGAAGALGVLAVASFAAGVWLTHHDQPWAFFSLPTRAWELAVGGLVAFATPWLRGLRDRPAALLGWAGLAAVAASAVVLTSSVPYPGVAALAPVLGTAAVLAGGCATPRRGPVLVLGRTTPRVLGRVSYSWYLWHWPLLILAPYAVGHPLSLGADLGLAAASLVLSVVSFAAVENPVRRAPWLAARGRVAGAAVAFTAAGVAACLVAGLLLPALVGHGRAPVAHLAAAPARVRTVGDRTARATTTTTAPAGPNPYAAQLAADSAQVARAVARSVPQADVPANLTPSLADADADEPAVFVDGCLDSYLSTALDSCDFGDTGSSTSVVLFGDSHAAMWFPAFDGAADTLGLDLYVYTKATCPPLMLPLVSPVLGRTFTECEEWRTDVLDRVARLHPALVVLGVARHYTGIYGFTPYSPAWLQGLSQMVAAIRRLGPKVLVVGPVPKPPFDVPGCLSVHLTSATACTVPLAQGIDLAGQQAERSAVTAAGGAYLVTQPWFCTATTCATVVDNLLAYRDDNHLTATYATYLAPAVTDEVALVLGLRPALAPERRPPPG